MTARSQQPLWTIGELGAQVALALSVDYQGPPNGRVRGVPDLRTIRYYTTLGLLDRAADMRGRTALYGRKHLLQLVAIKRLQARGLGLAEIQRQLVGLPEKKLRGIAQLPDDPEPLYVNSGPGTDTPTPSRSAAFWSMPAAALANEDAEVQEREPETSTAPEKPLAALPLQGLGIAAGVTLLLAARRPLADDDMAALRVAAAPLLKLLHKRRLV
jgi:DNA-binding transcriptional MerR regulator